MGIFIAAICVLAIGAVGVWLTPARKVLLRCVKHLDRYMFTCRVEQVVDESLPENEDTFFCVQMIGRIPTPEDHFDTDVKVEIHDVSSSLFDPEKILSADEQYRSNDDVGFYYLAHNGIVPKKNAVLSHWVTVTRIPCHVLRFAYRGRRKLQFKVTILSKETGAVLTTGQQNIEYVSCVEGFREVQDRLMDIFKSSIELACMVSSVEDVIEESVKETLNQWISMKAQYFAPASELVHTIESLEDNLSSLTVEQSADSLLAFGEQADKHSVIELSLQSLAQNQHVSNAQFARLIQVSEVLGVRQDRLLSMAQKILLSAGCELENPGALLGISDTMDNQIFRKTLNEEYRKWNARVTHPDAEIRQQADQILSLIADLRSGRNCPCA